MPRLTAIVLMLLPAALVTNASSLQVRASGTDAANNDKPQRAKTKKKTPTRRLGKRIGTRKTPGAAARISHLLARRRNNWS